MAVVMTKERQQELERKGGTLSAKEWREGWHFCADFDGDLCGPPWDDSLGSCEWCGFDGSAPYPPALKGWRQVLVSTLYARGVALIVASMRAGR